MTLTEASNDLNNHLRSKFSDPLKPWFCVGIRESSIVIMFDKRRPCNYTEWQRYPVEYMESGMPFLGTGDDE